jgi:capsular polysaccharide transport system permease protein
VSVSPDPSQPSSGQLRLPGGIPRGAATVRFASQRAIAALMIREMATRYGRSPGGYLWALLEPIGGLVVLSFGFALILRNPPVGTSFVLFYATGILPFQLYQTLSSTVARSVGFSKALLQYPAVTWLDAVAARFLLNLFTGLLVTAIVGVGVLALIEERVHIVPFPIMTSLGLTALLGLSVGVFNCALFGLIPTWVQIWSILTRPLFLASGIFFTYDDMPPMAQDILWFNPLIHVVGMMRVGVYPTYRGEYLSAMYVVVVGLILLFFGLLLMARHHRYILNEGT